MLASVPISSENKYEVLKCLKSIILKGNLFQYWVWVQNKHSKMHLRSMQIILSYRQPRPFGLKRHFYPPLTYPEEFELGGLAYNKRSSEITFFDLSIWHGKLLITKYQFFLSCTDPLKPRCFTSSLTQNTIYTSFSLSGSYMQFLPFMYVTFPYVHM